MGLKEQKTALFIAAYFGHSEIAKILLDAGADPNLRNNIDTNFVLHYYCGMKNVTITLDEEVARWARIRAAEENTSVSCLVGEMLREKMLDEDNYQTSMQNYLAKSPRVVKKKGDKYPDREALHDRQGLR